MEEIAAQDRQENDDENAAHQCDSACALDQVKEPVDYKCNKQNIQDAGDREMGYKLNERTQSIPLFCNLLEQLFILLNARGIHRYNLADGGGSRLPLSRAHLHFSERIQHGQCFVFVTDCEVQLR